MFDTLKLKSFYLKLEFRRIYFYQCYFNSCFGCKLALVLVKQKSKSAIKNKNGMVENSCKGSFYKKNQLKNLKKNS